jgi:hypothetical protein
MRLNTFLAMLAATGATCGAGWLIVGAIFWPEPDTPDEPLVVTPPSSQPSAPTPAADTDSHEVLVMGYVGQDLGTSKRKDVTTGRDFKINVYQDDGHRTANRAKVDLDRDEKWDEKWTFEGETITRQIAQADDENYATTQFWDGATWSAGAPDEAAAAPASSSTGHPAGDFIVGRVGVDLGTNKIKDATKGKPYKVNLYQDDGHRTVNRAKVDLDRDDKWDEKWTLDGESLSREVAPSDDENYSVEQTWSGTAWQ